VPNPAALAYDGLDAKALDAVDEYPEAVVDGQRSLGAELAMTYARAREAFGRQLTELQAIQLKLADMATKITAARLLAVQAARCKDALGEGTSEIQRTIIARGLVRRWEEECDGT
jgi:alkylation response protein AidB-like acyl-CoA dehydrogenase